MPISNNLQRLKLAINTTLSINRNTSSEFPKNPHNPTTNTSQNKVASTLNDSANRYLPIRKNNKTRRLSLRSSRMIVQSPTNRLTKTDFSQSNRCPNPKPISFRLPRTSTRQPQIIST